MPLQWLMAATASAVTMELLASKASTAPVAVLIHTYDDIHPIYPSIIANIAAKFPLKELGWRLYFSNEERSLDEAIIAALPIPITHIKTGKRPSRRNDFVSSLRATMQAIPEKWIMYLQEDYFCALTIPAEQLWELATGSVPTLSGQASSSMSFNLHSTPISSVSGTRTPSCICSMPRLTAALGVRRRLQNSVA
jgi:hypothetical protein